jgi:hypothetical protein
MRVPLVAINYVLGKSKNGMPIQLNKLFNFLPNLQLSTSSTEFRNMKINWTKHLEHANTDSSEHYIATSPYDDHNSLN